MHKHNKQQGGTVLGIIIGLVIGLGIALTVAVMITKTPMPFTDRASRSKAIEQSAGTAPDPNKPLYSNSDKAKEAAREFFKDILPAPANTALPAPSDQKREVQVDSSLDAGAPATDKPVAEKPVVEKPAAEIPKKPDAGASAARPARSDSADERWNYFLQAGAFRNRTDAEAMRGKLALQGVEAKVSERQSENGVLYRVRVGPFPHLDAMNSVRGKLTDNGVDAAVVRVAK